MWEKEVEEVRFHTFTHQRRRDVHDERLIFQCHRPIREEDNQSRVIVTGNNRFDERSVSCLPRERWW